MSSYKVFNYKTYDVSEIKYRHPNKSRGNTYTCNLDQTFDVLFQSRDLRMSSKIVTENNQSTISLIISDTDMEGFIKNLDKHNIQYIYEHCQEWFERELPLDAIEEFYKSNLEDGVLRLNVPTVKGKIDIKVFDDKKNAISYEDLNDQSNVVVVFRINGLKFLHQECVLDIDAVQIMLITPKPPIETEIKPASQIGEIIRLRDELKKKKEIARKMFEKAEQLQLEADESKEQASAMARELKEIEDRYYELVNQKEESVYTKDSRD